MGKTLLFILNKLSRKVPDGQVLTCLVSPNPLPFRATTLWLIPPRFRLPPSLVLHLSTPDNPFPFCTPPPLSSTFSLPTTFFPCYVIRLPFSDYFLPLSFTSPLPTTPFPCRVVYDCLHSLPLSSQLVVLAHLSVHRWKIPSFLFISPWILLSKFLHKIR